MYDFARGLSARGVTVDVLTTDVLDGHRRATPREEVMEGVSVRRLPNVSNSLAWRTKKYLPRGLLRTLARVVRTYDVVHVTDTRTMLTAATFAATTAAGVPLCLSAHGSLPGSVGLRGAVKRAYDAALVRPMLARAALLLAQTEHEAFLYRQFGGRPGSVRPLPLPLDLAQVPGAPESRYIRRRLGLADDLRIVLFLGRVHYLKGVDLLVEALGPLLGERLVLVVAGRDDGQQPHLQRRFAGLLRRGRLRFAGPIYGADRFAAYADADVFCLTPRHWEETSVATLEAAAAGTPVVVSEQAEIPGLTEAGGGFVVSLEPAAIRRAVETVLERSNEMGACARALVWRQHRLDSVVQQLDGYLREAAGKRPS